MTITAGRHAAPPFNGHTLAPFTIQTLGPVSALPRQRRRAVSVSVIEACYVLMAAVTIIATGVGFWLSYAGLHSFAVQAGLTGPEAWAWPASVDLFILAGELGITISTLRDGKPDWRAWGYFAAGCGPSVTFNVLHVTSQFPAWGKYAVAATPPIAAVLALAALMQQVIGLPAALRHMHARQGDMPPADVTPDVTPPDVTPARAKTPPRPPAKPRPKTTGGGGDREPSKIEIARAALTLNPDLTNADLMELAKCDRRTAQRAKKQARNGNTT